MAFFDDLIAHVNAGFAGIYVQTEEPDEFVRELLAAKPASWVVAPWDINSGLHVNGQPATSKAEPNSPMAPLNMAPALKQQICPHGTLVVVLHGYHDFLGATPAIKRKVHTAIEAGRVDSVIYVVTAPVIKIPVELERAFKVLDHPLPTREALGEIARKLGNRPGEVPEGAGFEKLQDAAVGLTKTEAENAFALSLARHGRITPDVVWDLKISGLKKSGLLSVHTGGEGFSSVGGLAGLKEHALALLLSEDRHALANPKGILLVGAPGTGKTHVSKALGVEVGRPTIVLDFSGLKDKHVGESGRKLRMALKQIDSMAPAILFCDEIEKALSGVGSANDSGVTDEMFGALLVWLNDHTSDVFVVMTANDLGALLSKAPEFARPGRFDGIFFVDIPTASEREIIWAMYLRLFKIDPKVERPDDRLWTGAEIRACCSIARRTFGKGEAPIKAAGCLVKAAEKIVPVAVSAADQLRERREWAHNRYLDAQTGLRYDMETATKVAILNSHDSPPTRQRKVVRSS